MFTQEDSDRQDAVFAELQDEFSRLLQKEKDIRKAAGLPEDDPSISQMSKSDITPDVQRALEEAKAKAKREGAARAAQFAANISFAKSSSSGVQVGRSRRGAMRI